MITILALALGVLAGWWRRGRTERRDSLDWYHQGFKDGRRVGLHDGLTWFGLNPQHKPTRVCTLDELAPHVVEGER